MARPPTLRFYRDEVLLRTASGLRDVDEYYELGDRIVAVVDRRPDAAAIYRDLFAEFIQPAVSAVQRQAYDRAYRIYRQMMVEQLQRRYLG